MGNFDADYRPQLDKMIDEETTRAVNSMSEDSTRPVYLFYKESDKRDWGSIHAGLDAPTGEGWELASTHRISPAWHPQRIRAWITDKVWELPVLPTEK
jgi:hypothetical protein